MLHDISSIPAFVEVGGIVRRFNSIQVNKNNVNGMFFFLCSSKYNIHAEENMPTFCNLSRLTFEIWVFSSVCRQFEHLTYNNNLNVKNETNHSRELYRILPILLNIWNSSNQRQQSKYMMHWAFLLLPFPINETCNDHCYA